MFHGQISGAQAPQHLILTLVETLDVVKVVVGVRLQRHSCQLLVSQYLIEDVLFVAIHHTLQMFALTAVLDGFPQL